MLGCNIVEAEFAGAVVIGEQLGIARPLDRGLQGLLGFAVREVILELVFKACPRRIVIGGGVSLMGEDLLFTPLREKVTKGVFLPFASCYDIVPAALGEEVVVHGALALARRQFSG